MYYFHFMLLLYFLPPFHCIYLTAVVDHYFLDKEFHLMKNMNSSCFSVKHEKLGQTYWKREKLNPLVRLEMVLIRVAYFVKTHENLDKNISPCYQFYYFFFEQSNIPKTGLLPTVPVKIVFLKDAVQQHFWCFPFAVDGNPEPSIAWRYNDEELIETKYTIHPDLPGLPGRVGETRLSLPQQAHPHEQWKLHPDRAQQTGKRQRHRHWEFYGEPFWRGGSRGLLSR